MLTREQIHTLLMLRHREGTLFNQLPMELIGEIRDFGQDPNSDFAKALHHVAFGELNEVKTLLEADPSLVLLAGNVVTPGGLTVIRTSLLGCALGSGDPEMAAMVMPHYSKIEGGEDVKEKELESYRPFIEGMLSHPYDLTGLIAIIKQSSSEDVKAALNINKYMEHKSLLRDALIQFRNAVEPHEIKIGMHYNYQTLIHAFDLFDREWKNLRNGNNYDKCDLVWRQVVGYLQRSLPAVDRFAFARGLYNLVENKAAFERKLEFKYGGGPFPDASGGDFAGLGFDYGVALRGGLFADARVDGGPPLASWARVAFTKLMSSKNFRLGELMQPRPREKTSRCVVC